MNVLVVMAHPEPRSFNGALRDRTVRTLAALGHRVEQSDLHAMRFDPVCSPAQFSEHAGGEYFNVQAAQRHAVRGGTQAADVAREQAKLARADLVVLHFPVWWFGVPAILKGWIDRVFALEAAYGGGRWFDHGVFRGKRAVFCLTTGAREDRFSADGLFGPIDWVLHPLRVGTFNFCGFDTLEPFIAWAAGNGSAGRRTELLDAWAGRLQSIEAEAPQPFRHLQDYPGPRMRDH